MISLFDIFDTKGKLQLSAEENYTEDEILAIIFTSSNSTFEIAEGACQHADDSIFGKYEILDDSTLLLKYDNNYNNYEHKINYQIIDETIEHYDGHVKSRKTIKFNMSPIILILDGVVNSDAYPLIFYTDNYV
jgi:hypothetical protein